MPTWENLSLSVFVLDPSKKEIVFFFLLCISELWLLIFEVRFALLG